VTEVLGFVKGAYRIPDRHTGRSVQCPLGANGLRFHDFRGTAATRLYRVKLPLREIAEILAWSENHVEKIINRYVKRDEILQNRIRGIEQGQDEADATTLVQPKSQNVNRTGTAKLAAKLFRGF
jgi:hypothetical protein